MPTERSASAAVVDAAGDGIARVAASYLRACPMIRCARTTVTIPTERR
jgi:hypothetical protein